MKLRSRNGKMTFDFIRVDGMGTILTRRGPVDVFVYGHLTVFDMWKFIVHQDMFDPTLVTVSEVATGLRLRDENYYTVEDALYYAVPFIYEKRYYLATTVDRTLVRTRVNLSRRNNNPYTLAIDTALWL